MENLCTSNVQNWRIVYIKYRGLCTKLKNDVHWMYKTLYILCKIVYVEYTNFFLPSLKNFIQWIYWIERLYTLNIKNYFFFFLEKVQNYIDNSELCTFFEKLCRLNIHNWKCTMNI